MNSCAEPVLEGHALAPDPARDQHDLLVLDVDAFDRADPLGELEHLGLGERRGRVEAALALPDQRRVQALLDRRPDREGRREVIALDDQVGAVAHADFLDAREQLVGGVASEDVGQAGLDADPDERQQAGRLPLLVARQLDVAEHLARQLVGSLRMPMRQRHRHVEVGHLGLEAGAEDRLVEARIAGVQHRVRAHAPDQLDERGAVGGVDALGGEAVRLAEPRGGRLGALERDVGEHDLLEHRPALGDRRERRAHAPRSDHENLHRRQSDANEQIAKAHRRSARAPLWLRRLPYAAPIRVAPDTRRP